MRRWLGPLMALLGILLVVIGIVNLGRLLAAPLEAQRGYLASTVFPLLVGLWLLIGGTHATLAARRRDER